MARPHFMTYVPAPPANDKSSADTKPSSGVPKTAEEKLASLKAFRPERGLCDSCPVKWSHDHPCAPGFYSCDGGGL